MRAVIDGYNGDKGDLTVADLIAYGLSEALDGIGVLADRKRVETTYYEINSSNGTANNYTKYDSGKNITSLMWTIPLGTLLREQQPEFSMGLTHSHFSAPRSIL